MTSCVANETRVKKQWRLSSCLNYLKAQPKKSLSIGECTLFFSWFRNQLNQRRASSEVLSNGHLMGMWCGVCDQLIPPDSVTVSES